MNKATRQAVVKQNRLKTLQFRLAPLGNLPEEKAEQFVKNDPAMQAQVDEMFTLLDQLKGR